MEVIYFSAGFILASIANYAWYLIGRKTSYQDINVAPPPAPLSLPKVVIKKDLEPSIPPGWVDDTSEPSMATYRKGKEL
jgi:hypothetical protein